MTEEYIWEVEFLNGNKIKQIQEDGTEISFAFVHKAPYVLHLIPTKPNLPTHSVFIDTEDKRLIFFKRRIKKFSFGSNVDSLINTIWALGWQMTISGRNIKNINWYDPSTNRIYNCNELNIEVKE